MRMTTSETDAGCRVIPDRPPHTGVSVMAWALAVAAAAILALAHVLTEDRDNGQFFKVNN